MKKFLLSIVALLGMVGANAETVKITSSEIISGKTGDVELATNSYGSQDVATRSTWYTFAKGVYSFEAAKIASSPANYNGGVQIQGNTAAAKQGFIANTNAFGKISKITITARGQVTSKSVYVPDFSLYVGDAELPAKTAVVADTVKSVDDSFATYTLTYTVTGDNGFFQIKNDKTGALYMDDLTIEYTGEVTTALKAAGLKWSATSVDLRQGDTFTAPTFSKETTATVKFTSSDDEVASVSEDGVITLGTELGTTTITAKSEANSVYDAGEATCTITVYTITDVTCAEAVKVAQALSANNVATTQRYAITGYVTETNGTVSKGQQVFWMADTKDGGQQFEAYWANVPDGKTAFAVGDKVKLTGCIMKYNTTSEMKNGDAVLLEASTTKVDTIAATAAEAYKVAAALASGSTTNEFYKITAYVDSVTYNFYNGTQSFTLTDTKGVKGDSLVVFKATIAEEAFVGAKVEIVGKLTNYKGVAEIAQGGKCTILEQGEKTAIRELEATDEDAAAAYNLAGQKVGKAYKGVVIKRGRKFLQR